jgi:hypothetical protein
VIHVQVTYCERWNDQLHAPVGERSADEARALDAAGKPYAVVIGDPSAPDAEVQVHWKNSLLAVSFIDEAGRTHLKYVFRKVDDQRLFLSEVTTWTYPQDARFKFEATKVENIFFQPDGYSRVRLNDKSSDNIEISEYRDVPVDSNWEPVPKFGEWSSVARYQRN